MCRTVGLHWIHTASGAALKEGQGNYICSWHLQWTFMNLVKTSISLPSCTFEDDCLDSDWLSIPDDSQQKKMVSSKAVKDSTGRVQITHKLSTVISCDCQWFSLFNFHLLLFQITLKIKTHLTAGQKGLSNFACQFSGSSRRLCSEESPPQFPQCTCTLSGSALAAKGNVW